MRDLRECLASNTIRPRGGAGAAVDVHHDVALAPAGAAEVADRVAVVAHPARDRVDGLGHRLLVGAALGRAARGLGGHLDAFSRSERSDASSSFNATICSRIASSCASWRVAASRAARRCAALKSASGLDPSAEENCRSRSSRIRADCSSMTCRN